MPLSGWFTAENFPVAMLMALPWIALLVVWFVFRRNRDGSLVADRNRAIACSLFLGFSSLCWFFLHIQPGLPYPMYWGYPPLVIPQLIMTISCIVIIWMAMIRHPGDVWLWLLALTAVAYPVLAFLFTAFFFCWLLLTMLYGGYASFTIFAAICTLLQGKLRLGFVGLALAVAIPGVYLLWDAQQPEIAPSQALSPESTQLLQAATQGELDKIQALLGEGADIHALDDRGWDVLTNAVKGGHVKVVKYLLEQGADPGRGHFFFTAFTTAAEEGSVEILQVFLDAGSDPAADEVAVSMAAIRAQSGPLRLLLEAGGNPDDGIDAAVNEIRLENLKMLLEYGADPNAKLAINGHTPLMSLGRTPRHQENEVAEIFKTLIAAGADVNYVNDIPVLGFSQRSVLMQYVRVGRPFVVQMLIDAGANPDHQDSAGMTALMIADLASITRILLAAGADTSKTNNNGQTVLEYAKEMSLKARGEKANDWQEIISALSEEG